ncbi:MAG: hypothetical protein ABEI06_05850 [Halobacteriaceae archaeon]
MSDSVEQLKESPVDFRTAVAYALHPEMRRLIILYIVGAVVMPIGLEMFLTAGGHQMQVIIGWIIGLILAIIGAALLFAGLIGTAFKVVTDANRLAIEE